MADSSKNIPRSRRELVEILQQSIARHTASDSDEINPEHLALLCEGNLDQISDIDRDRLLREVARSSWAAQAVAELRAIGWGAQARPDVAGTIIRFSPLAWAVAALLLVSLGIWRLAAPPADNGSIAATQPGIQSPGQLTPNDHPGSRDVFSNPQNVESTTHPTNPPKGTFITTLPTIANTMPAPATQAAEIPASPPSAPAQPPGHHLYPRDFAFVIAATAWLLLTIPAIYWVVIRRQIRNPGAAETSVE